MTSQHEFIAPSWDQIYELLMILTDKIKEARYRPDLIIGICRGGWPPARVLSDLLDNPNLANVRVEFYIDIKETAEEPRIIQPVSVSVKGKKVLVVDDVADSGKSLKLVREHLVEEGASDVRICTIYHKPWSIIAPEYSMEKTEAWIVFPWERRETCAKIGQRLKNEGKSLKEIEDALVKIGLKRSHVRHFLRDIFKESK